MLNQSKGPAMWSPRAQSDRMRFAEEWRLQLERLPNLDFYQDMVSNLIIENHQVKGVKTSLGIPIYSKSVILTNGTFLNGVIHIGMKQLGGGRAGEKASKGITECLVSHGFESGRMKTGTPPRVDSRSLDYSKMIPQPGDENPEKFSFSEEFHILKAFHLTKCLKLNLFWKRCRKSIYIHLHRVPTFGFYKNLMAVFIGKSVDFILN